MSESPRAREHRLEHQRQYMKGYYQDHKAERKGYNQHFRETHKQEQKEYDAHHYQERRPQIRQAQKTYRENHKDEIKARMKRWHEENREYLKEQSRLRRRRLFQQMLDALGHRCACCGEKNELFLSLEHKDGDGAEDRRSLTWDQIYKKVIQNPDPMKYEVLCFNCNLGKRRNGGLCPHKGAAGHG